MNSGYYIRIQGLKNPNHFVETWSSFYSYPNDSKYYEHIHTVLKNKDSFIQLFQWKNGTGDVISKQKMKVVNGFLDKYNVLNQLKKDFSWELFEKEFQPTKSSTIWKIFLLHLINHKQFPIYDQHVFRFYYFYKHGMIEEISKNRREVFSSYKEDYKPWFNSFQKEHQLNRKKMDESFFLFGQVLKRLKGLPIEILK